jgi:hypothetical protein
LASKALISLLKGLDLYKSPSVFFLHEDDGKSFAFKNKELKSRLALIKPTAFYIFNHQPLILFFDLSEVSDQESEKEIHKKVWSFDQSPIIFVVKTSEVKIFNAFSYNKRKEELDEINISGVERNEQFSFWNLQSGNTWRWLQSEYYEKKNIQKKRVNQKLYENIKAVRQGLLEASNKIGEDDANILILRLIFIRYLIDRDVKLSKEFITGDNILKRRKSLIHLIEEPRKLNECFVWLNEKFNGVLFKDIKVQLSKETSIQLAKVFDGEIPDGLFKEAKDLYFEVFDFSIIPIELISGIYEALLDEETRKLHSAVYTPLFLVEYILTQTIDKHFEHKQNIKTSECKVFDPSVGSGIFLVQAFRRMVDREIELFGKVSKTRLKEIAKNNLFGIDINRQALKVSCFSIYIAMLDYQDPATITDNFKFPELIDTNLFEADFFNTNADYNNIIKDKSLNFILGNPPWKSSKGDFHLNWLKSNNKITGRFEIAQSFLLRSKDFMQSNTISSLIVTSTIFYNISSTTKSFKKDFLTKYCIKSFFDLSPVRRMVFEEKDSPCSIVTYQLSDNDQYLRNTINHISVKSNLFLKYFKQLVIEKFDQKTIKQIHFIENDWMFKVALYGNVLDYKFLRRLNQNSIKIIDLIDNKLFFKGAGILEGNKDNYEQFKQIIGKLKVENKEIKQFYTQTYSPSIIKSNESHLKSGRIEQLFDRSQILIKEQAKNESELVVSLSAENYVFKKGIFGITSKNENKIKWLFGLMNSNLFTYYTYIISGSWGVSTRPQIRLDEEYLAFPILLSNRDVENEIIDAINYLINPIKQFYSSFKLGEPLISVSALNKFNDIIEKNYSVNNYEKDLISYVLDISRYQFQESKIQNITRKVHKDNSVLESYVNVFIQEFKDLYKDEYMQVEVYALDYFIAMNFVFKSEKPKERIVFNQTETTEKAIFKAISKNLTVTKISEDLFVQKDIKGFEDDSFYIIKPNEYKCWHRAMAWYDVAEIKSTIEEAEIEYLNVNLGES